MEEKNQNSPKRSHGFLIFTVTIIILAALLFGVVKFINCIQANNGSSPTNTTGTSQGSNTGNGNSSTQLFSRSANSGDIVVSSDLNLSSLGVKYTITPQTDINGLVLTITFLDKDLNPLTSMTKAIGNVKKGVQVNFSVSLIDLGLSVAWNTNYERIAVTGGTVSYFA